MKSRRGSTLSFGRLLGLLICASALAAGCTPGTAATNDEAALLAAEELRESSVAPALELVQLTLDLCAPALNLSTLATLHDMAERDGCALTGPDAGVYRLTCLLTERDGEPLAVSLTLAFFEGDLPIDDPSDADRLEVTVEGEGALRHASGSIVLLLDPERGVVASGELVRESGGGDLLLADFEGITARMAADLPGVGLGVFFTSGNVDLELAGPHGPAATGTAGLVGRKALVLLNVSGVHSTAEVNLGGR